VIYFKQGLDSAGVNFGSDILKNYDTRPRDYGFKIGSGIPANCVNASALVSWEPKENVFLDFSVMYRTYTVHDVTATTNTNSTTFTIGLRINMFRRQYDY
jgi:hypothetical protein